MVTDGGVPRRVKRLDPVKYVDAFACVGNV
jgi:hypothetical protein